MPVFGKGDDNEPRGHRMPEGQPGWLFSAHGAEMFRRGTSPRMRCRWCGSQMRWTGRGAMICAPADGTPGCDGPDGGPTLPGDPRGPNFPGAGV